MEKISWKGFHFYRKDQKWLVRGGTYGPFRPSAEGDCYPESSQLKRDFEAMASAGFNTVRLYTMPSQRVVETAARHGLRLLIDIPWPKHLDVYGNRKYERLCLQMVRDSIEVMKDWPNLLGVFLGNEIPSDLVRWNGRRRVQAFLKKLYFVAKGIAPDLLIGFSNYPSTEYLPLEFFDFLGFNVYLEDQETFRDYLIRLRHLYPETPLILSEIGLDSQQHGEAVQAKNLSKQLQLAYQVGLCGAVVFSWTDEWHTGGFDMTEWSFGLVDRERNPKPALAEVSKILRKAPQCIELKRWPGISVVVAAYNAARTLRQCLHSLKGLHYPDYEIVVVDDGSTDETPAILREFDGIGVVRQNNLGLSAARNAGIHASTGEIIAFTDSDCVVDPDWLYHLALEMQREPIVGVGGPNLSPPEEGLERQVVAMAPGHATHVLLSDKEAEHVPGCNMAFYRSVLLEVDGFDPVFTKAGDDVDMIWRLQEAGYRIGFSPAAFVWHHRRPTLRAYFRQQQGYGEAEAALLSKHPHRFNERGHSRWHGTIYANNLARPLFKKPNIHYGIFGSAGYQCIYPKAESRLVSFLTSVEWCLFSLVLMLIGVFSRTALLLGVMGLMLPLLLSAMRAAQTLSTQGRAKVGHFL
ncbi:MAG TPA: glycosyltransferase, partial [candidate division Zixibacteria bacterium]|nr:glycosyltransferase [candidate division Zixibacteria bacterium]